MTNKIRITGAAAAGPVRVLVPGAGVIGGACAGGLLQAGHQVVMVARGQRLADLRTRQGDRDRPAGTWPVRWRCPRRDDRCDLGGQAPPPVHAGSDGPDHAVVSPRLRLLLLRVRGSRGCLLPLGGSPTVAGPPHPCVCRRHARRAVRPRPAGREGLLRQHSAIQRPGDLARDAATVTAPDGRARPLTPHDHPCQNLHTRRKR